MNRQELAKFIEQSLLKDINLTEEEYKQRCLDNDNQTAQNGYTGKASVSESKRARRMAMNFYGTILNILINIHATNLEMLAEQKQTNRLLETLMQVDIEENKDGE